MKHLRVLLPVAMALFMQGAAAQQQQYPSPINRDVERFEKSVRTVLRDREPQDLTEIGHEARKAAYQLVIATQQAVVAWKELDLKASTAEVTAASTLVEERTSAVPGLTDPIRRISFLDPIEDSADVLLQDPKEWSRLQDPLLQLYRMALSIRTRVDSFYGLKGVEVAELDAFSLRTMIDAAKTLAESISKTVSQPSRVEALR